MSSKFKSPKAQFKNLRDRSTEEYRELLYRHLAKVRKENEKPPVKVKKKRTPITPNLGEKNRKDLKNAKTKTVYLDFDKSPQHIASTG